MRNGFFVYSPGEPGGEASYLSQAKSLGVRLACLLPQSPGRAQAWALPSTRVRARAVRMNAAAHVAQIERNPNIRLIMPATCSFAESMYSRSHASRILAASATHRPRRGRQRA